MTIQLKSTVVVILALCFTYALNLGFFTLISPAIATHFGSVIVYSDVFTGGGNSSIPINKFAVI